MAETARVRKRPRHLAPTRSTAIAAAALASVACVLAGCATPPPEGAPMSPPYALSAEERAAGFELLFDGDDLDAWRGFRSQDVPAGWHVAAGAIYFDGRRFAPDLVTRERYASFELALEWRTEPGHNSGILFRVTEEHRDTWESGPEFQILDDEQNDLHRTGANYALHAAAEHPATRNPDGWNEARIVVRGARVEHWLNGVRVVDYELGSDDWRARVANSKFDWMPDYGLAPEGHVALQAHGSPVWFRHVRIRRLAP